MSCRVLMAFLVALATPALAEPPPKVLTEKALAPIKLGKRDTQARALIRLKKWGAAAKKITASSPAARLVKGLALHRAKKHTEALAALKGLEKRLPILRDFIQVTRADALLSLKRYAEAVSAAQKITTGESANEALRIQARALRELGDVAAARKAYQTLIDAGGSDVPGGLLGLARVLIDVDPVEALKAARRLDLEYPAHWTARHARKIGKQLAKADKTLAKLWADRGAGETLDRAEILMKHSRNKQVVAAMVALAEKGLTDLQICRRRYALGRSLRKLRKWKEARPALDGAVTACETAKSELAAWARYVAGQAAERLGEEEAAAALYTAQMEKAPTHRLADDAGYFLVRHLVEDKEDLDAARKAAEALAKKNPTGDMVPHTLFFVAAQAMLQGRDDVAKAVLLIEEALPPRDYHYRDGGRTPYWQGRLAQKAGDTAAAKAHFEGVIATQPLGWYSILAYSRLREMGRKHARMVAKTALFEDAKGPALPGAGRRWQATIPKDLRGPHWERAQLLARVGLAPEAWLALQAAGASGSRADLLWLSAFTLDRAGAVNLSHDILRRRLPEYRRFAPKGEHQRHWQLAFPRPYASLVRAASKETGVERDLIWAIMREESAFTPTTESWANAMGLMQLIMTTAKGMAKKGEKVNRSTVKDPELNVRLGARYLARVFESAGAVTPLVPAGYNAGAGALRRWMKARPSVPLDLFVELIPYEEARGYTKRVMSSYATYRLLYSKGLKDPLPYLSQSLKKARKGGR